MGTLYLVATPIGNLDDITLRALRTLREVAVIAAEDTRHSGRLLKHHGIATPMMSYHEHSPPSRLSEILDVLATADVALISDAGTPGISDPGYALVRAAVARDIPVVPIPGPSAVATAVPVSGLVPDGFLYLGFLPRRAAERLAALDAVTGLPFPLVVYEAPHRLVRTLSDLDARLGGERPIAICRELTKLHEEIRRTTVREARAYYEEHPPRGEFVLVIGPADSLRTAEAAGDPEQLLRACLAAGASPSAPYTCASWCALSTDEIMEVLFHDPQHPRVQRRMTPPDGKDEAALWAVNFIWTLGCTAKLIWPIPDKGLKKRIHRISAPTLIAWGDDDGLIPPVYAEEFHKAIANSQILRLPACGHEPPLEQCEQLLERTRAFFEQ